MSITKPMLSKKKNEIPRYNISGYVSKHTGLKPGRYEKAVIMNGVRNAAPSKRKKIMEELKTKAGTADMFKTTKPKMAMRKPKMSQPTASEFKKASRKTKRKIKRETKKELKAIKKIDKAFVDSAPKPKMKSGKAMTKKEIKKANQEYGGKSWARMMKQIGKAENAKDQGKKRRAKRLTKRVNRIAKR